MSLSEGEEGISITEGEVAVLKEKGTRCLVGRIGTEKRINRESFKSLLLRLWRPVGGVSFKEIQENLWIFEFSDCDDKRRVLSGRPWLFDRYILVINDLDGNLPPSQMEFTNSLFWVQVHNMPLICMTKGVGQKIAASLGEVDDVDIASDDGRWGRFLRLRIVMDLSRPLERGWALELDGTTH